MKKILFLIHDLGRGGAEKVLVNLVNHMDYEQFDICVTALFGGGVNEQFLDPHIHFRTVFPRMIPGNTRWMKWLSPSALHKLCVKEHYDVEISYLEGPSARVISGCVDTDTELISWIHSIQGSPERIAASFRSVDECKQCYGAFDRLIFVSQTVGEAFMRNMPVKVPGQVLYNTVDSAVIREKAHEKVDDGLFLPAEKKLAAVGTMKPLKAFDRLIRITGKLRRDGIPAHLYLLGRGPEEENLRNLVQSLNMGEFVTFLGYQTNPYWYLAGCDLFICSSLTEGFSTAATEALIVGTPVCTTEVSGMREMLGDNKYGLITDNNEEALFQGVKKMLTEPGLLEYYREKAQERGKSFSTEQTVQAVEKMLNAL